MKQPVVRIVRSLFMACDPIGNVLLAKFTFDTGRPVSVFLPSHIVFWLLRHVPVNQDPQLQPPPQAEPITEYEWHSDNSPTVLTLNCNQFQDALRMTMELDNRAELTFLLNRSNIEMLRQLLELYRTQLVDLDAE
ncbi:MAG: hypothetical protein V4463_09150 [Pseudomonadota bacterium]